MDNLNLLYVALTRAENGLFVFAELPKKPENIRSVGDVIYHLFNNREYLNPRSEKTDDLDLTDFWNDEENIFRLGSMPVPVSGKKQQSLFVLKEFETGSWHNMISIRQQADILSTDDISSADDKINYGILLHNILSMIHTKEQVDHVLAAHAESGNLAQEDIGKLSGMLDRIWSNEKISNWFSGGWEIKTEVPVLPEKGNIRRMDRVMIKDDLAIVVDYKTGVKRSHDLNQVKNYKNILRRMGYKKIEGYVLYLNSGELVEV